MLIAKMQCANCNAWFPSPIGADSRKTLNNMTFINSTTVCPQCGKSMPIDPAKIKLPGEL